VQSFGSKCASGKSDGLQVGRGRGTVAYNLIEKFGRQSGLLRKRRSGNA
jgi:hypothetical protein